jgi:hypothetical protein
MAFSSKVFMCHDVFDDTAGTTTACKVRNYRQCARGNQSVINETAEILEQGILLYVLPKCFDDSAVRQRVIGCMKMLVE